MLVKINDRPLYIGGSLRTPGEMVDLPYPDARDLEIRRLVTPIQKLRKPEWFPDWSEDICVVIGSGPSAKGTPLSVARNRAKFFAINNSWKLAPWADCLFGIDFNWWTYHQGVPKFHGIKISLRSDERWDIKDVRMHDHIEKFMFVSPGEIGWGGNSGFGAINLCLQFGCRHVVLVGFDMQRSNDAYHWHEDHPGALKNPDDDCLARWARKLDQQRPAVDAIGAVIVNASPDSALRAYHNVDFAEYFNEKCIGKSGRNGVQQVSEVC